MKMNMYTKDTKSSKNTKKTEEEILRLCDIIRETSYSLHCYLKHGHLEKVYENGLINRLRVHNIEVKSQFPLEVKDIDGTVLGTFYADILIEDTILVELKACKQLAKEHHAQIFGYLRACGIKHGMLINFGAPRLEVKKYILPDN